MKLRLFYIVFILLPLSVGARQNCDTQLTNKNKFSDLNNILSCLNDRINYLETKLEENRTTIVVDPNGKELENNRIFNIKKFNIGILGCTQSSGNVTCDFSIANVKDDDNLSIYSNWLNKRSRIIDYEGVEYVASSVSVSSEDNSSSITKLFVKDVAMVASLIFTGISINTDAVALIELSTSEGRANYRNVPISR